MRRRHTLFLLIVTSSIIRLLLNFLPSFTVDMSAWLAWAYRLAEVGPGQFYADNVWTQYTPGFLYWLWLGGKLGLVHELWIKIPIVFADIITATLIWQIARKHSPKAAPWLFLAYALNPVTIFIGSVWGQIDGLLSLLMLLAIYLGLETRHTVFSWVTWAAAFLIKPQAIAILPILIVIHLRRLHLRKVASGFALATATIIILSLPFFPKDPLLGFPKLVLKMGQSYQYTSLFAYNLWTLTTGMWQPDNNSSGLSFFNLGTFFYILSLIVIIYIYLKTKSTPATGYLLAALGVLAFFLFPTRVHDRYLFPFFAFLLAAIAHTKSRLLKISFGLVSSIYLINLYTPYAHYTENFLKIPALLNLTAAAAPLVAILLFVIFLLLLFTLNRPSLSILTAILVFSLLIRVIRLGTPPEYHFDEVYHAFTAREMLHGNVEAWEWWNQAPKGVAYEWTHPPLSKHFMVLGMQIFGDNAWGWRLPGVLFGLANIYLVYLLTKQLFPESNIPLIAAGLYSVESLTFVQSRIGMNDTYMIFFMLFSLYALLRCKLPASMLSFGLALATKWSAIYIAPLLAVIIIARYRHNLKMIPLLATIYLLLATGIYLLSYAPFFASGHTWKQFIELQQQMFWYHTRLNATHDYSSPAWSWPLLLRPVWYYVKYADTKIANIYALGNPIIFWGGLLSVLITLITLIKRINWSVIICLAGYLLFLLPWVFSPRIMFLYHYLPSIPFMVILLAWVLSHKRTLSISFITLSVYVFLFFYPHLTALPVPLNFSNLFYWLPTWK